MMFERQKQIYLLPIIWVQSDQTKHDLHAVGSLHKKQGKIDAEYSFWGKLSKLKKAFQDEWSLIYACPTNIPSQR
jgi:hypothetical protein